MPDQITDVRISDGFCISKNNFLYWVIAIPSPNGNSQPVIVPK